MKRYLFLVILVLLLLSACSGSVKTTTLPVTDNAFPTESEKSANSDPPVDPVIPTDTAALVQEREFEIVTLLPRDGIPAIDNPVFISAEEADLQYDPDELVIGVNFGGDARAYSIPKLSSHEIVNDTVGGRKIAVTW